jgi:hypothetical protein
MRSKRVILKTRYKTRPRNKETHVGYHVNKLVVGTAACQKCYLYDFTIHCTLLIAIRSFDLEGLFWHDGESYAEVR